MAIRVSMKKKNLVKIQGSASSAKTWETSLTRYVKWRNFSAQWHYVDEFFSTQQSDAWYLILGILCNASVECFSSLKIVVLQPMNSCFIFHRNVDVSSTLARMTGSTWTAPCGRLRCMRRLMGHYNTYRLLSQGLGCWYVGQLYLWLSNELDDRWHCFVYRC